MSTQNLERVRKEYVTLGEAAQYLSVNPATIWRWVKEGKLVAYPLWREVLIMRAEIERLKRVRSGT